MKWKNLLITIQNKKNMSNQLFGGSICLTDMIEQAKKGHSAFAKSDKNGKVYCNILTWLNEKEDKRNKKLK